MRFIFRTKKTHYTLTECISEFPNIFGKYETTLFDKIGVFSGVAVNRLTNSETGAPALLLYKYNIPDFSICVVEFDTIIEMFTMLDALSLFGNDDKLLW